MEAKCGALPTGFAPIVHSIGSSQEIVDFGIRPGLRPTAARPTGKVRQSRGNCQMLYHPQFSLDPSVFSRFVLPPPAGVCSPDVLLAVPLAHRGAEGIQNAGQSRGRIMYMSTIGQFSRLLVS